MRIIISILILISLSSIIFAAVEGDADLLGWAYNATTNSSGLVNITYNYSSLLTWITDENKLDLFYWNGSDWLPLNAALDTDINILITEQDKSNLPKVFVLGENNKTCAGNYTNTLNITNCCELQHIDNNLSGNYVLMNDIDCSDTVNWNNGAGFDPIGDTTTSFIGTLDGQGYIISDLFINRPTEDYVGLFGYVTGAQITNVGLENVNISGNDYVGGLIGEAYGVYINNVYLTGEMVGEGAYHGTGGIAGLINGSSVINNAYVNADVSSSVVGGLIGWIYDYSYLSNSYFAGSTKDAFNFQGGLVGLNYGVIINCFVDSSMETGLSSAEGSAIGLNDGAGSVANLYWNNRSDNKDDCYYDGMYPGNTGCMVIQDNSNYFKGQVSSNEPMASWDFTNIWHETPADYPVNMVNDIQTSGLVVLNQSSTRSIFRFFTTNYFITILTDVSWGFDTDDNSIINSLLNTTDLDQNESLFVYIEHNYSGSGTYNPNATSINGSLQDTQQIGITI